MNENQRYGSTEVNNSSDGNFVVDVASLLNRLDNPANCISNNMLQFFDLEYKYNTCTYARSWSFFRFFFYRVLLSFHNPQHHVITRERAARARRDRLDLLAYLSISAHSQRLNCTHRMGLTDGIE